MTTTTASPSDVIDDHFDHVLERMQINFDIMTSAGPVFKTRVPDLFAAFIDFFGDDAEAKSHYNRSTCKDFLRRYGSLVVVTDEGQTASIMFRKVRSDSRLAPVFERLAALVEIGPIESVFVSADTVWGKPQAGGWSHFSVTPPASLVHKDPIKTASEAMADNKERFKTITRALSLIKPDLLDETLRILRSDHLHRSDRYIAPIQWLRDLHDRPKGREGNNLLWKAITLAPEGFCHPRSGVMQTLFDDVEANLPFDVIKQRFEKKMDPMKFQRPQVAPSSGTILQAEKLIQDLNIAKSLERRYARLEEVRLFWQPAPPKEEAVKTGIFAHLKAKDELTKPSVTLPAKTMTWEKFTEKVLPSAKTIQLLVPHKGNFTGCLTAVHADAPPILKWDKEEDRYPISFYLHHNGSYAQQWRLTPGSWTDVTGLTHLPEVAEGVEKSVTAILKGAVDTRTGQGNGLFPEILISSLFGVRSVIEAYSKTATLEGREEASANGVCFGKNSVNGAQLRVDDGTGVQEYMIDRWE